MLLDYPDRERMQLLTPELDELLLLNYPPRFVAEFVYTLDRDGWAEAGVEIHRGACPPYPCV